MAELSVLVPARNEQFLGRTVEDVLSHIKGDTEIIVVLDGAWPDPGLPVDPRLHVVYQPSAIGQRAATNLAARVSEARYLMKLDAHCGVSDGFDVALMDAADTLGRDVTQIPRQYNLHVFDWECQGCGTRTYQGPTPTTCTACAAKGTPGGPFERVMVWNTQRRRTDTWRFDSDLKFGYFGAFQHRPEGNGEYPETMSCLGACWFLERERFWELGGLDEGHGGWGQMGTEIACKSWLSGGRMVTNTKAWFSHLFRTQGGDFGFPYPLSNDAVEHARAHSKSIWLGNAWPGQVRPLRWLVEKFAPVPGWTPEAINELRRELGGGSGVLGGVVQPGDERGDLADGAGDRRRPLPSGRGVTPRGESARTLTRGIVYYSDNRLDSLIAGAVQRTIDASGMPIVAVTLQPIRWPAAQNIVLPLERGYLAMFRQILAGLEALETDVVFFCEHDVLYHPSHFDFTPPSADRFFYNEHVWKVDAESGHALHYRCSQTSGLCADRKLLREHYRKRVQRVEQEGFTRAMGFEPGTHGRKERIDDVPAEAWMSEFPNVDIRHNQNLTPSRWRKEQFRNQRFCAGWTESDSVPGWGTTAGRMPEFLAGVGRAALVGVA